MRCSRLFVLSVLVTFSAGGGFAWAFSVDHVWSKRFGDVNPWQTGLSVARDPSGNVVTTGYFYGTVDFGGVPLTSAGQDDIFLVKLNAAGNHVWSYRFGDGSNYQWGNSVATDASGNVILGGGFRGSANFGGGPLTSLGQGDVYLARFDAVGYHVWSYRYGDGSDQGARGVAVDAFGNVIVVGQFAGSVNFGGGLLTSAGGYDVFLAKFGTAGNPLWSQRFGDASDQWGMSVAVDPSGNVVIGGNFSGSVDFGGGSLTSAGGQDVFLAKFDAAGGHVWSERFGDGSNQETVTNAVTSDVLGNVIVTGNFYGSMDFGGGPLTSAGARDVFLAKFDAAGGHVWSKRFGDAAANQYGASVAADAWANVIATGYFAGTVDFGGGSLISAGSFDIFHATFDAAGRHVWSKRFGDAGTQRAYSVTAGVPGEVILTGDFWASVDFGGGSLTSAGSEDIFLAKFETTSPAIVSADDVANDQGRQMLIGVSRSSRDSYGSSTPILQYEAFRRIDPLASGSSTFVVGANTSGMISDPELLSPGWVFAGAVPAHGESEYNIIVATLADSTIAHGMHYSVFFIRAATADPYVFYDSDPDSGYSLDNLSPSAPQNLAYASGMLSWDESGDADFDYFTAYGSSSSVFDGSAVAIDHTVGTSLDVQSAPYAYYFVTATDFSGNEGQASGVSGAPVGVLPLPEYMLSVSAYPNPFTPGTIIGYTLPAGGKVEVSVYDGRGARVATLVEEEKTRGVHTVPWEGRDDRGMRVSSGLYFVKVSFAGEARAHKIVLLR